MTTIIEKSVIRDGDGKVARESWALARDEAALETLYRDLFGNHWDKLTFGAMLPGGAYELKCPKAPEQITVSGGYLTVHWGRGGHFHLCIGESRADTQEEVEQRKPAKVELVRGMDKEGHPVTWSLQAQNGAGQTTLAIYFPNPFITDEDKLAEQPDWSRLALWHEVLGKYAGDRPDGRDTLSKGFGH